MKKDKKGNFKLSEKKWSLTYLYLNKSSRLNSRGVYSGHFPPPGGGGKKEVPFGVWGRK